jgi:hypothetical protein
MEREANNAKMNRKDIYVEVLNYNVLCCDMENVFGENFE